MRAYEIPEGVEVPEIEADDLEVVEEAGPVTATAIQRHRGASVAQHAGDLFGVVASYAERGITFPIESLERLIALQERAQERNARDAFNEALAAFQEACPPIRKTKKAEIVTSAGGSYSYTYAPLDEIARVIRPFLRQHGLSYSWNSAMDGALLRVTCTLRHIDGHLEASSFTCPIDTAAKMSGAQKHGAALTFGERMSLIQVTGLTTTDEDIDGAEPTGAPEPINAKQVEYLRGLLNLTGSDARKFLRLMGVEDIVALPAARYDGAKAALEEKLAKMEERARQGQPA